MRSASLVGRFLAQSDYHLFLSIANDFAGEKNATREACENPLSQFFGNRGQRFLRESHHEITFEMAISYRTKQGLIDLNRIIFSILNKYLNFV